jgi:hypothetical protein
MAASKLSGEKALISVVRATDMDGCSFLRFPWGLLPLRFGAVNARSERY